MTVREALREGAAALAGSETPFLDASLLLADLLGMERGSLLASGPEPVGDGLLAAYRERLGRRAAGLPVAYILGRREFWGRGFAVDSRVLVPRPDTETLVAAALEEGDRFAAASGRAPRVHETCCGSGCVILSIAADRPSWAVSASDLSAEALEVAAANARAILDPARPGGPCAFARSDLLSSVPGPFDLIVANPPYVPGGEVDGLLARGWSEPRMALDGGSDGLEPCRRLLPQAFGSLAPGGAFVVEADGSQADALRTLLSASGFSELGRREDLAGIVRVSLGRKPWAA